MLSLSRDEGNAGRTAIPEPAPLVDERYTVLLLDESQLDRFLRRPSARHIGRKPRGTIDVWPVVGNRRTWAAGSIVGALAVWAMVWLRASSADPGIAPTPTPADLAPTVPTGASFSVTVASFVKDAEASTLAGRLDALGMPAFAWRVDGTKRQVMLGPYVAIDEAEAAQRALATQGYRGTRLYVDERLRSTMAMPASLQPGPPIVRTNPAVVLVAAPGRLSLAFELPDEPRQVRGRRISSTFFELDAGPVGISMDPQEWSAPADVQLVKHVSVMPTDGDARNMRARLTLSETANATVRVSGLRVYVDISRSQPETPAVPAPAVLAPRSVQLARAVPRPAEPQKPRASLADNYREAIGAVMARFEAVQPFLRSAVASPSPEVLAALGGTFGELEASVSATDVPPEALASHGLLASAVQLAREAVAPEFTGDRMGQVREAAAQFAAAKGRLRN